jgi:hypothetical protein
MMMMIIIIKQQQQHLEAITYLNLSSYKKYCICNEKLVDISVELCSVMRAAGVYKVLLSCEELKVTVNLPVHCLIECQNICCHCH